MGRGKSEFGRNVASGTSTNNKLGSALFSTWWWASWL